MRKGNNRFTRFQKALTAASGSLPSMDQKTFHAVAHKGEGKVCFDIAAFQQLGGKYLCQGLIAKLIQFIPDAAVLPFSWLPLEAVSAIF